MFQFVALKFKYNAFNKGVIKCFLIFRGQFATVKRCRHKASGEEYAAKFIRKRRGGGRRGAKMEDIQKEIHILSEISHANIIKLYDVFETTREVILVLEL